MKKSFIFLILCLFTVSCSQNLHDENQTGNTWIDWDGKVVAWDFPVMPGSEEWKKFTSHQEMVDACQIPIDILSSLSTDDLARICLRYPLLADIFAFNFLDNGLDGLFIEFNGVKELYNRDASNELLNYYSSIINNMSFLDSEASGNEKGRFLIRIFSLEALLSRLEPQYVANKEYYFKEILKALVAGYEEQLNYPDEITRPGCNFFARAHLILKICEQCRERLSENSWGGLLAQGWISDLETIEILNELSYQLIK